MQPKEIHYYRLFRDVCKVINSSLDLKEVLKLIAENIVTALEVKACSGFLWDRKRNTLELSAAHGLGDFHKIITFESYCAFSDLEKQVNPKPIAIRS